MRILAAHQPNFIPPFSYFVKLASAHKFVIMTHVQFSKTGYQNYQTIGGKRWTNPVVSGLIPIKDKKYTSGHVLHELNFMWIQAIAGTLGIDISNKIVGDFPSEHYKTDRIIQLCNAYQTNVYLANADAKEKYLNVAALKESGIKFMALNCPERRHVFEMFDAYGIEKTRNILWEYVRHTRGVTKEELKFELNH